VPLSYLARNVNEHYNGLGRVTTALIMDMLARHVGDIKLTPRNNALNVTLLPVARKYNRFLSPPDPDATTSKASMEPIQDNTNSSSRDPTFHDEIQVLPYPHANTKTLTLTIGLHLTLTLTLTPTLTLTITLTLNP
jgi:hypothetical protein